jgi:two-component system chemotaxis response regulator CheY
MLREREVRLSVRARSMKSVVIVEDSKVVREIAARIVKELGLEPKEFETASAAVEACRAKKPDAVLLDWDLPSLAALDFLRGVGEFAPEMRPPIVLCATENDHQQFALAKAAGAAHYILKPFDAGAIASKLAEIGVLDRGADLPKSAAV